MRKKIDSYLGFAKKSRSLVAGASTCTFSIKKIKLLIIAEDISENTVKKMVKLAEDGSIPYRIYGTTEELSKITGSADRGIYGVTDVNFADVILRELDGKQ